MAVADTLAQNLGCPPAIAVDLVKLSAGLATAFVELRAKWDIDLLINAHRLAGVMDVENRYTDDRGHSQGHLNDTDLAHVVRKKLPRKAKALFDTYETALGLSKRLSLAHDDLIKYKVQVVGSLATFLFDFLNQQNQLSNPQAVAEGRVLFDAISNDQMLLREVAVS